MCWGYLSTRCQMEIDMAKIVALSDMTREQKLMEMETVSDALGGIAFDMISRKARLSALIKSAWTGAADYDVFRDIIHRKFAIGFYIKVCSEMGKRASVEDAVAALTAPTKSEQAAKADARATASFADVFKATELENPKARAPRTPKGDKADKSDKSDTTPDAPAADAPATNAPGGDASQPTLSVHGPVSDIVTALTRLAPAQFLETIGAACAAKAHAPGKSFAMADVDCLKAIVAQVAAWKSADQAETARDVTPQTDAPAEPAKVTPKGKRQAKAA